MKPIVIKVCQSNECAKYQDQLERVLTSYEPIDLVMENCLNRCSFCENTPYVLINNGVEFGDDMDELFENIEDTLRTLRRNK